MILIMGATGNVGRHLVSLLGSKGVPARAVSRRPDKLLGLPTCIEPFAGDLRDAPTVRRAFEGVDDLVLLPMFGEADGVLIGEAQRVGVRRVVMISTVAPDDTIIGSRHRETENRLRLSGLPYTILRTGAFMSNALDWAASIKSKGVVFSPAPNAETAPIAPRDVAAAAVAALSTATGPVFELTGHEALTTCAQVRILSEVLQRNIDCVEISIGDMAARMTSQGAPTWLVDAVSEQMSRIRDGRSLLITHQFEQLVQRPPLNFKDWCVENRQAF